MKHLVLILVIMLSGCATTYEPPRPEMEYRAEKGVWGVYPKKRPEIQMILPVEKSPTPTLVETAPPGVLIKKKSKRLENQLKRIHQLTE
ncbi:MAG: hypothetical protein PHU93_00305 [Candidatus Gracilibacteria bacterium]|nr:hypothetical protein [Candidatus Gracilibacteria bacterium]